MSAPRIPYDVVLKPPAIDQRARDNNLLTQVGRLQPRARETRSFVLPKLAGMKVILLGGKVSWSFQAPSGEVLVPGKSKNLVGYDATADSMGFTGFILEKPEQGKWTVTTEASKADTAVEYGVLVEADGPVEEAAHLETMLRDSDPRFSFLARPGDPVYVRAFITRNGHPVPGITWEVNGFTQLDSPIVIPVFDDGRHADGGADDGVSVGAIVAEGPDGHYRLIAKSRTPSGVEYSVTAGIEVQAKNDLLIADSIAVSPRNPKVGETVTLTVTAMNDGTAEFRDAELELYVDRDKRSGQKLDLKPGESRRVVTTWVPTRSGAHAVQLTLASYDEPYASDFTNNTRRTIVRVK